MLQALFANIFLPVTLAIITLGMGLSLTDRDFRNIFVQPKAVLIGLCCQMVLLPVIAWLIVRSSNIHDIYKVGLMIIAACPGGATSNLITYLLRGNVALSISMTAINSLITLITIPLVVTLSLDAFLRENHTITMEVGKTIRNVFLITVLPAFTGTRLRKHFPDFATGLEKPLRIILPLLLMLVYAGVIFTSENAGGNTGEEFIRIFPYALLLNVLAMGSGLLIARLMRLRVINQFTISIEVGLQNSALAIYVASALLMSNEMALVPLVYGSFTFFSTLLFGWFIKKLNWTPRIIGRDT
jgi:BASS family bile acid:Na+ symporter